MIRVRPVDAGDAAAIAAIYRPYVLDTAVTFEEVPPEAAEIEQRIASVAADGLPWFVADIDGALVGYGYATKWRPRSAYRFSTEVTVYVAQGFAGRGIGSAVYAPLFDALRERGIHAAMGGIALPNDASIALHEKFGFRKVAHLEQVGFKFGRWIDLGYWQKLL